MSGIEAQKPVKDTSSAMSDALVHGTGISLDGKHIPLDEFYARPAPTDDEQVMCNTVKDSDVDAALDAYWTSVGVYKRGELLDGGRVWSDKDKDAMRAAMSTYAARVRAEERERCAKIAETTYTVDGNDSMSEVDRWVAGNGIAAAIRTGDK